MVPFLKISEDYCQYIYIYNLVFEDCLLNTLYILFYYLLLIAILACPCFALWFSFLPVLARVSKYNFFAKDNTAHLIDLVA